MDILSRLRSSLPFHRSKHSFQNSSKPQRQSLKALDRLNLSLGDVRDVFEPYLTIFLAADRHWNPAQIGTVIALTNLAGILAQTPMGALVDKTHRKRALIAIATVTIAIGYIAIVQFSAFPAVLAPQVVIGVSAVTISPSVSAITLGLVGKEKLQKRVGRNESFNHIGNVGVAILAGAFGPFISRSWIFYFFVVLGVFTLISVFQIRHRQIDHAAARAEPEDSDSSDSIKERATIHDLLKNRALVTFGISVVLFCLANASLLTLVSQELTSGKDASASLYVSACIVVSQLTMIPVAAWASATANRWGRKPLLLIAFAAVVLRAVLYTFGHQPLYLVAVQSLDGIASGIVPVLVVIIVSDLTQGTGRFNLAQGVINSLHWDIYVQGHRANRPNHIPALSPAGAAAAHTEDGLGGYRRY